MDGEEYMIILDLNSPSTWIQNINEKENNEADIELFPNPTGNLVNFKTNEEIVNIKVLSLDGNIRLNSSSNIGSKINLQSLNNGIYIIRFQLKDGRSISKKVFKN
jgi:hypothetical protein